MAEYKSGAVTTDEELVRRIAAGDEQALAELYRRYAPRLTALARHLLRDPLKADASVQTAFVHVWETAGDFETQPLNARTWLLTQSQRLFTRHVRERNSALENDSALALQTDNDAPSNPSGSPRRTAPTEPLDLLRCAFFQGSTDQMLAELTGRPVAEINQALRTALTQLSRDFKERNP